MFRLLAFYGEADSSKGGNGGFRIAVCVFYFLIYYVPFVVKQYARAKL